MRFRRSFFGAGGTLGGILLSHAVFIHAPTHQVYCYIVPGGV